MDKDSSKQMICEVRQELSETCKRRNELHNAAELHFVQRNNVSTAISLFFQAITEAGLLAIISDQLDNIYVRIAIAAILAMSIFVSTYSMYKDYSKRASDHHAHAVSYKRICDRMMSERLRPPSKRARDPENLIDIAGDVTLLENYEPAIPGHIIKKYNDRNEEDLEEATRRSRGSEKMETLVMLMDEGQKN